VTFLRTVQTVLKRGALVAAANWPVTFIQAVADSIFKLLMAVPLIGGIFLVGVVVGDEPVTLLTLEWRELAATIFSALLSHPLVLALFILAMGVVTVGGSLFVFLVKGGTVSTLVRGEREATAIEVPPLHWSVVTTASKFSVEAFIAAAPGLFPRYARLGALLMAAYVLSGAAYLGLVMASRSAGSYYGAPALVTALFVAWITAVNLAYLLVQIVIAADDCGVGAALRRVGVFVRRNRRLVFGVFIVILAMVVLATGASIVATAALGVISFVPFFGPFLGLAVLPLQIVAWLLRELVFQYIGLASIGAYAKLYRESADAEGRLRAASSYPVLGQASTG
jgi:hypothetical protein